MKYFSDTILKHSLDPDGVRAYWNAMVDTGFHLSRRILEKIDFSKGEFYTLLPETADSEGVYEFRTGLLPLKGEPFKIPRGHAVEIQSLSKELSAFVEVYLKKNPNNFAIYEHPLGRPEDPFIEALTAKKIFRDNEVYLITPSDALQKVVSECVSEVSTVWHCLIILTKGEVPSGPELTDAMIDAIIDNASCIIIGAYDGEGYLFWEPNKQHFQEQTLPPPSP